MKGLYINIPSAEEKISTFADTLRAPIHIEQARTPSDQHILVDNHIENWPQGAIHNDQNSGSVIAASGYLVYKDVLGNLQQFLTDFVAAENQAKRLSVCDQIQAGSFVIYIETPNNHYLITDPFGLNPHYQDKQSASLIVAPVPTFVAPDRETDTALCRIIEKNRHLFGNLTGIVDVERLEPGALIHNTGLDFYFNYFSDADTLENTRQLMEKGLGYFSERKKILPLSGGLDSRYLLSVAKMDYGYTYGPEQTGDRPIARTFSKLFEEYREFSLLDFSYPKPLQEAGDGIFKGTVGRPLSELLVLYQDCCNRWGQGCVFIDGYMGDTLQRGIYFNITGAKGVLFRLLPSLMFRFSSPEQLLLARYEKLDSSERELLLKHFRSCTARFQCDEWKKLLLFEVLYGRGARFIVHGGSVMANQYFTALQPFVFYSVFRSFMQANVRQFANFSLMKPIWRSAPTILRKTRTLDVYRPSWPWRLNRFIHVASRITEKLFLGNKIKSYKEELSQIKWI